MRESIAALGLGIVALACCVAGPLIAAAIGALSLAVLLGWGAALVAVVAAVAILVGRRARAEERRSDR
jgi:membrane protein implicated in regulation of membrane protease activity